VSQPPDSESDATTKTLAADVTPVADVAVLVLSGDSQRVVRLPRGVWVDLGRSREAFISVDDDEISRLHIRILVDDVGVTVEDLGSKNGTFIDGIRMGRKAALMWPRGAVVVMGQTSLVLVRTPGARAGDEFAGAPETADEHWDAALERIAQHDVSVMILGETGVGKEVAAERIHKASPRRDKPLVKVHASAIVASLFESELFGHERGAFTGATHARAGLFEQARGGTLFLDEIGELTQEAQVKLLRVLDDRRVRRVGSDRDQAVDFRLITATHRSLEDEVRTGTFRKDLFFRIAPFAIRVPPLRDRISEVPALAQSLLADIATGSGRPSVTFDDAFLSALLEYDWPGNVRELRGVLEHAFVVGDGVRLREVDLPKLELLRRRSSMSAPRPGPSLSESPKSEPPSTPEAAIRNALEKSGGNQKRAAELLGISRRTLLYQLDRYGIARPRKSKTNTPEG
jgi:two-component system, NtrC family, response regulator AtoC